MEKICPRCGVSDKSKKFIGSFCIDCYLKGVKIEVPHKIKISQCKACGKMKFAEWQQKSNEMLERIVSRESRGSFEGVKVLDLKGDILTVAFLVRGGPEILEIKKGIKIEFEKALCEDCFREVSGYYEAIIQLRGDERRVSKFVEKLSNALLKKTFISKVVETRDGTDIYVGSKQAVTELLSYYKLKTTTSDKLYGVRDGRRVFRRTYCIRL